MSVPFSNIISDHDKEATIDVNGYDLPGQFQILLTYDTGWEEAVRLVDMSENCEQYMRWDCLAAIIHNPISGDLYTYWKNRDEMKMNYFGGADIDSGNCSCGGTSSCFDRTLPCNCDANDNVWRFDEGFLDHKFDLPIHSFYCGDTGNV